MQTGEESELRHCRNSRLASTISTQTIYSEFPRNRNGEVSPSRAVAVKKSKLHQYNTLDRNQRIVLGRLQKWYAKKAQPLGIAKLLDFERTDAPSRIELISLIKHYFPPRADTRVQVFDFGDNHVTRTEISLGDAESGAVLIIPLSRCQLRSFSHAIET